MSKLHKAVLAQDGHSVPEQAVYAELFRLGGGVERAEKDGYLEVSAGQISIGRAVNMSARAVARAIKGLVAKLAIEISSGPICEVRQGTRYRVYSYSHILERRRKAGLTAVIKDRGRVHLVDPNRRSTWPEIKPTTRSYTSTGCQTGPGAIVDPPATVAVGTPLLPWRGDPPATVAGPLENGREILRNPVLATSSLVPPAPLLPGVSTGQDLTASVPMESRTAGPDAFNRENGADPAPAPAEGPRSQDDVQVIDSQEPVGNDPRVDHEPEFLMAGIDGITSTTTDAHSRGYGHRGCVQTALEMVADQKAPQSAGWEAAGEGVHDYEQDYLDDHRPVESYFHVDSTEECPFDEFIMLVPEYDPEQDDVDHEPADVHLHVDNTEPCPFDFTANPETVEDRILTEIAAAGKPLTVAELSQVTSVPAAEISQVAYGLLWSRKLRFIAGSPSRFGLPTMAGDRRYVPLEDRITSLIQAVGRPLYREQVSHILDMPVSVEVEQMASDGRLRKLPLEQGAVNPRFDVPEPVTQEAAA